MLVSLEQLTVTLTAPNPGFHEMEGNIRIDCGRRTCALQGQPSERIDMTRGHARLVVMDGMDPVGIAQQPVLKYRNEIGEILLAF